MKIFYGIKQEFDYKKSECIFGCIFFTKEAAMFYALNYAARFKHVGDKILPNEDFVIVIDEKGYEREFYTITPFELYD